MSEPFIPNDLITPNEAAELLRVNSVTVRRWVWIGRLPGYHVGGRMRLSKQDVLGMIKRVQVEGKAPIKTLAELRERDRKAKELLRSVGALK